MIDFALPASVVELRDRVSTFVREVVIPAEVRDRGEHGVDEMLRRELQSQAREAGVFAPQVPTELGGLGLDHRAVAVIFEEAGYSLLGPPALNCAAPDEGNMLLLDRIASSDQRARYLAPLTTGAMRSCFAMTEPAPGAGSDPSMLQTIARRRGEGWSISGRKWFITGAQGAGFAICMARAPEGPTMFIVDADNPGWRVERVISAMDRSFAGGHCEVVFDNCEVPADAVLGVVGEGFRYAQTRLAPARLTHCMRWLGVARRAMDIAIDRAVEREAFGQRLADLGMVQERIALSQIDLETSRALIWKGAWALDRGGKASRESSIAKAHVAEVVGRIIDRSLQICGSLGVSHDLPLARLADEVRPFRIYDGPTETHLWSIARRAVRDRQSSRPPRTQPLSASRAPASRADLVATAAQAEADGSDPLIIVESLTAFLDAAGLGTGPLTVTPVGSGHSNVTLAVSRGEGHYVLRRPPRGPLPKSAHDVIREARLQRILARHGVRVPEVLAVCESPGVIGAPFYVMGFLDGHVLESKLPTQLSSPGAEALIADELVRALFELHAVDITATEFSSVGRIGGYLERQLKRFTQVRQQTNTRSLPELDAIGAWLTANQPTQHETTMVHGDYRLGNVMFSPEAPRIMAILDWEMATLGDPLADVGYMTATWAGASDPDEPMLALSHLTRHGFPDREYLADRYRTLSGRSIDQLPWYETLALWKSAIFLEASYSRYLAGTTDDPFFASLESGVPALVRRASAVCESA